MAKRQGTRDGLIEKKFWIYFVRLFSCPSVSFFLTIHCACVWSPTTLKSSSSPRRNPIVQKQNCESWTDLIDDEEDCIHHSFPCFSFSLSSRIPPHTRTTNHPARKEKNFNFLQYLCTNSIDPPISTTNASLCRKTLTKVKWKPNPDWHVHHTHTHPILLPARKTIIRSEIPFVDIFTSALTPHSRIFSILFSNIFLKEISFLFSTLETHHHFPKPPPLFFEQSFWKKKKKISSMNFFLFESNVLFNWFLFVSFFLSRL